jgi:dethiobiotin synthetase
VVTGTDTGVGKTITTAAIAAAAGRAGLRVAVLKPGQTGFPAGSTEESDVDTVVRLADPASATTMATYPDPLAPSAAARVSGLPALELFAVVDRVHELRAAYDLVLIEGAGGLLVPMGWTSAAHAAQGRGAEWNVADLATVLGAPMVVVTRAGLGTLNHTALTLEALGRREITAYVVVGSWPAEPELVHRTNLEDLPVELDGVLPEGAGTFAREIFRELAPSWLSGVLHGSFSAAQLAGQQSAQISAQRSGFEAELAGG